MPLIPRILGAAVVVAGQASSARPVWLPAIKARRLDPLTLLAAQAVDRLGGSWPAQAAVVVGSAWGCVTSTLRFADDLRTFGEAGGSPTAFSSSVHHNLAGSLGELLQAHGPAATISQNSQSGLAALRWAGVLVATGRAPEVLVVAADLANPWTMSTVAALSRCPFSIAGGATALRIGVGKGRPFSFAPPPSAILQCDAGGMTPAEERHLARAPIRRCAAIVHGCWWPTAALAAVPWDEDVEVVVSEPSAPLELSAWIGRPA
jgi:hypothetical protein